jgi:hypothetical protein
MSATRLFRAFWDGREKGDYANGRIYVNFRKSSDP